MKIMDLASVVIDVEGVESRSFSSDANNNFRTADLHSSNGWSVEEVKRSKRRASFQTCQRHSKETLVIQATTRTTEDGIPELTRIPEKWLRRSLLFIK